MHDYKWIQKFNLTVTYVKSSIVTNDYFQRGYVQGNPCTLTAIRVLNTYSYFQFRFGEDPKYNYLLYCLVRIDLVHRALNRDRLLNTTYLLHSHSCLSTKLLHNQKILAALPLVCSASNRDLFV